MVRVPAFVAALLFAAAAVLGWAAPASAHATLVSSDPAEGVVLTESPGQVTFTFDESVQLLPNGLQAFDAEGESVDVEATASDVEVTGDLPDDLDDGTYVVTWRVVSADGHPIAGSLTFHVGAPSAKVEAPKVDSTDAGAVPTVQAIVHGVNYVALLLAGGLVVFLVWTIRGVRLDDHVRRRLVRVLQGAALAAVATAVFAVPLAGAYQLGSGLSGVVQGAAFDPGLVRDELVVAALQALGLGLAAWSAGRDRSGLPVDLAAALAVFSPALVGHTRAYEPSTLLVVTDALHLAAGAVWLGGLAGLALTLPALAGRPRDSARLLTRFSTVAAGLLVVIALSGILLGWRIVGSWERLAGETYGRLLLVKVALVLVVVALAAWNRFRLLPGVTDDTGHERQRRNAGLVRRTVVAEAAVVVAVLAVTGFLTQKPPAGDGPGQPATADTGVETAVVSDDLKVLVVLDAGSGLQRRVIVQVQDLTGEPLDLYDAPVLALSSADVDLGQIPLVPVGTGTYTADVVFPGAGAWDARVSLRVDEFTSPVTTLALTVS